MNFHGPAEKKKGKSKEINFTVMSRCAALQQ